MALKRWCLPQVALVRGKEVCAQPWEPRSMGVSAESWMWSLLGRPA